MTIPGVDPGGSRGLFIYDEQNRMRGVTIHDTTQSAFDATDGAGAVGIPRPAMRMVVADWPCMAMHPVAEQFYITKWRQHQLL